MSHPLLIRPAVSPRAGAIASVLLTCGIALPALSQVAVGGIQFIDRAVTGEIILGNQRGSFGVIDFDRDGFYDLFIANSAGQPHRLFRNVPSAGVPGGRTFQDVSASSGINDADGTSRGFAGVVVFDYNNDGWDDIYQVGPGTDGTSGLLYRNNGNATFTNVSVSAGVRLDDSNPLSASSIDFDHDGWADLLVVNIGAGPNQALVLLRNNRDGTFINRSDLLPPTTFGGITYAHGWSDYDGDGWADGIIPFNTAIPLTIKNVADDSGGRRFIDATVASGFTFVGPAPMGIAFGDYDRDGRFDLSITDAAVGTYYRNNNGVFERTFPFNTFFGWGTSWLDANNDSHLDNYQAGSAGRANIDFFHKNNGPDSNGQMTWTDAREGLNIIARPTQFSAVIDFDNNGFDDIVAVNVGQFVSVYHNQSASLPGGGHWSKVLLRGSIASGVNSSAVGAVVRLTTGGVTQVRQITIGSSYAATEDPRASFGLGSASTVDQVEVLWPRRGSIASRTQVFEGPFPGNSLLTLTPNSLCLADLNADRVVDDIDFTHFAVAYNQLLCSDPAQPADCPADLDFDGLVTDTDFILFALAYQDLLCP